MDKFTQFLSIFRFNQFLFIYLLVIYLFLYLFIHLFIHSPAPTCLFIYFFGEWRERERKRGANLQFTCWSFLWKYLFQLIIVFFSNNLKFVRSFSQTRLVFEKNCITLSNLKLISFICKVICCCTDTLAG